MAVIHFLCGCYFLGAIQYVGYISYTQRLSCDIIQKNYKNKKDPESQSLKVAEGRFELSTPRV